MEQPDASNLLADLAFWIACQHRALELGEQAGAQICAEKMAAIQQRLVAALLRSTHMTERERSLHFECDRNPLEPALTRGEYNSLIKALLAEGYQPGAPALAAQYDRPTIESIACAACGGWLRYEPWLQHWRDRTRYRAFAVCPSCGAATEF